MNMLAEYLDTHGREMQHLINVRIKLSVSFSDSILPKQNRRKLLRRGGNLSTFVPCVNTSGSSLFDCPKNRGR